MRTWFLVCLGLFSLIRSLPAAPVQDFDELLRHVREEQQADSQINREREQRFLTERDQQQRLLAEARAELAREQETSRKLRTELAAVQTAMDAMDQQLRERAGVVGELLGTLKELAADVQSDLRNSLISAQYPGRDAVLEPLVKAHEMPTLGQLEQLWFTLLQEMVESGKVTRFHGKVKTSAGETRDTAVVRVGAFSAFADGKYLRYVPETGHLLEMPRQPDNEYLGLLDDLDAEPREGLVEVAIDPTRGGVLSMLMQVPNTFERIKQGGVIGYIIIALGVLGGVIVAVRMVVLYQIGRRVATQLERLTECRDDNPLGRILAVARDGPADNPENLELRIDEAVMREIPQLERGQALVRLLIAVAPLLGLLGTVTGMIQVFQSITLYGSGDPRLMAGGIAEALVTTMLGLQVAIPLSFLYTLMTARSRTLIQILDEQSAGLLSRMLEQRTAP
ncbi:MAG TPA: MotA/TolQ/ExbB proton channel family protein [Methylococcus sp.]|nr:MotA/TolQ/ExbB proton channel family protein [Methylococcus sp.]